ARGNFVLDRPEYSGASVLVAGANFGCGSSREHAPWALRDFGFRAIIAPSFADIFRANCYKTGLLAVTLPESQVRHLIDLVSEDPPPTDLPTPGRSGAGPDVGSSVLSADASSHHRLVPASAAVRPVERPCSRSTYSRASAVSS